MLMSLAAPLMLLSAWMSTPAALMLLLALRVMLLPLSVELTAVFLIIAKNPLLLKKESDGKVSLTLATATIDKAAERSTKTTVQLSNIDAGAGGISLTAKLSAWMSTPAALMLLLALRVMLLPLSVELTAVFLILPSKSSVEV
jgi:hypothetical protein